MTHPEDTTKHCSVCDQFKPLDAFHRDKKRKHGRYPTCAECYRMRRAGKPRAKPTRTRYEVLSTLTPEVIERFWLNVDKSGDCWEWQGTISPKGYGEIGIDGWTFRAHRVAYVIANGPIVDEIFVLHECDNRKCCRPDDLFLGTTDDNMADMAAKGRAATGKRHGRHTTPQTTARGERQGNARLTAAIITEIRQRYRVGNGVALAREYGISQTHLSDIVNRKTWRHVP